MVYLSVAACLLMHLYRLGQTVHMLEFLKIHLQEPGPWKGTLLGRLMSEIQFSIDTSLQISAWASNHEALQTFDGMFFGTPQNLTILPLRGKHRKKSSVFNSSGCPKEMEMKPLCSGNRPGHGIGNKHLINS